MPKSTSHRSACVYVLQVPFVICVSWSGAVPYCTCGVALELLVHTTVISPCPGPAIRCPPIGESAATSTTFETPRTCASDIGELSDTYANT